MDATTPLPLPDCMVEEETRGGSVALRGGMRGMGGVGGVGRLLVPLVAQVQSGCGGHLVSPSRVHTNSPAQVSTHFL